MAFDANGFFQRLFNWSDDRDAGVKILAERMDQEFDNFKGGIDTMVSGDQPMRGPLKLPNGLASAPSLTFSGGSNTGLYRNIDGTIGFVIEGVQKATLGENGMSIAGLAVTGPATFDGRDLADDGAKLDLITITQSVDLDLITVTQSVDLDLITVTQSVDLDVLKTDAATDGAKLDLITVTQSVDLDLITVTQSVDLDVLKTDAATDGAKLDLITVTQSVDLDLITVTQSVDLDVLKTDVAVLAYFDVAAFLGDTNGPPDDADGVDSEIRLDAATAQLYRKAYGVWAPGANLKGIPVHTIDGFFENTTGPIVEQNYPSGGALPSDFIADYFSAEILVGDAGATCAITYMADNAYLYGPVTLTVGQVNSNTAPNVTIPQDAAVSVRIDEIVGNVRLVSVTLSGEFST